MVRIIFIALIFMNLEGMAQVVVIDGIDDIGCADFAAEPCDEPRCEKELTRLLACIQKRGYMDVRYNLRQLRDTLYITIDRGSPYKWREVSYSGFPDSVKNSLNSEINPGDNFDKIILDSLLNDALEGFINSGYAGASLGIDSITFSGRGISARIHFNSGDRMKIAGIDFVGNVEMDSKWLMKYLNLDEYRLFDEKYIHDKFSKLNNLGFIFKRHTIRIDDEDAYLEVDIDNSTPSSADGIAGLMREPSDDSYFFSGYLNLGLSNLFGTAKSLNADWVRLRPKSQQLSLNYRHPGLIHSSITLQTGFHLLKSDTTFLDRNFELGTWLLANRGNYFIGAEFIRGRSLINYEETQMELSEIGDFDLNYYNVGYEYGLENLFFGATVGIGNKKLAANPAFDQTVYEGLDNRFTQIKAKINVSYNYTRGNFRYIPSLNAGLVSSNLLFRNDLFRLGGFNNIRGFTENSFFTPGFVFLNNNIHVLIGEEFQWLVFYDQAVMETEAGKWIYPLGFGTGIELNMNKNIRMQLISALGKSPGDNLSLENTVIHLGLRSVF